MPTNQVTLPKEDLKKLKVMRDRSPEEWVDLINDLPYSIRPHAARIVWWDWFGLRTVGERWNHLDEYLSFTTEEAPFQPLAEALESLGYPEKIAITRAS